MPNNNLFLYNVAIARPFLIVLLVFYHAFAIYTNNWEPIHGQPIIPSYWWIGKVAYAFLLELFVFISGYVYGFQVRIKGIIKLDFRIVFCGKFKRLIVPCVLFSLVYLVCFYDITQPIYKTVYSLIIGAGHMWFLPMLFILFLVVVFVEKIHLKPQIAVSIFLFLSLFSYSYFPFRIGYSMYYMPFFYFGYIVQRYNLNLNSLYNRRTAILLSLSFLILFPILTQLKEQIILLDLFDNDHFSYVVRVAASRGLQIVYSFVGLIMFWCWVGLIDKNRKSEFPDSVIRFGGLCFGIYLIQEFLLRSLYYYTRLPQKVGFILLPWIGFFIALVGSVVLSFLFHQTKVGRFLIG